jgi:hypothetical protein
MFGAEMAGFAGKFSATNPARKNPKKYPQISLQIQK